MAIVPLQLLSLHKLQVADPPTMFATAQLEEDSKDINDPEWNDYKPGFATANENQSPGFNENVGVSWVFNDFDRCFRTKPADFNPFEDMLDEELQECPEDTMLPPYPDEQATNVPLIFDEKPWSITWGDVTLGDGLIGPDRLRPDFPSMAPVASYQHLLFQLDHSEEHAMVAKFQTVRYICDLLTATALRQVEWVT